MSNKLDKPLYDLERVKKVGEALLKLLSPACNKIEIAGSVRRNVPLVHDLDIVAWPKYTNQPSLFSDAEGDTRPWEMATLLADKLPDRINESWPLKKDSGAILKFEVDGIPVEIYTTLPSGENYGSLLQMRTGSAALNIRLASRALQLGLKLSAGRGVFNQVGERIDKPGVDEAPYFEALGFEYIDPSRRSWK
jgi:DNA polymerase/3'-5' exonuclease PolX